MWIWPSRTESLSPECAIYLSGRFPLEWIAKSSRAASAEERANSPSQRAQAASEKTTERTANRNVYPGSFSASQGVEVEGMQNPYRTANQQVIATRIGEVTRAVGDVRVKVGVTTLEVDGVLGDEALLRGTVVSGAVVIEPGAVVVAAGVLRRVVRR